MTANLAFGRGGGLDKPTLEMAERQSGQSVLEDVRLFCVVRITGGVNNRRSQRQQQWQWQWQWPMGGQPAGQNTGPGAMVPSLTGLLQSKTAETAVLQQY